MLLDKAFHLFCVAHFSKTYIFTVSQVTFRSFTIYLLSFSAHNTKLLKDRKIEKYKKLCYKK